MKLTIFALIPGLCLVAVQAGIVLESYEPANFDSFDEALAAGIIEPETESVALTGAGLCWILKGAFKTVTGLKCTAKEVNAILSASENFVSSVENCPGQLPDQMLQLITGVKQIITTSQGFDSIDQTYCKSNSHNQSGWNCFWKMLHQSLVLTNQIGRVINMLIKVPTTGANTNSCVSNNIYQLHYTYSSFSNVVKSCKAGK